MRPESRLRSAKWFFSGKVSSKVLVSLYYIYGDIWFNYMPTAVLSREPSSLSFIGTRGSSLTAVMCLTKSSQKPRFAITLM